MPTPHLSTGFADLLDPRFQKVFFEQYGQLPDMVPTLFNMTPHNNRNSMLFSQVGALGDWEDFGGTVLYDNMSQGYDTTVTYLEFVKGIQIERKLFDDDQYNIMDQRPRGMALSAQRTRQKQAARMLNNAFSVDNYFYVNSEAVALCSNSHTTTASGASTASGFDNLTTAALSATAVASARIQMVGFRDDRANRISVMPDELWYPPDLYDVAYEIVESSGRPDSAENNANVQKGRWKTHEWNYMTDANNWFMCDSAMRKMSLHWVDRIPLEFGYVEDFDTFLGKWRGYYRAANAHTDWRFILGAQVS